MNFPLRKTLKGRRAVVIGSGPGGLSAAISLAVRGARVAVLEPGAFAGGALRSFEWNGYSFPVFPPHFSAPRILAELFASTENRISDFLSLQRAETICRFSLAEGGNVDLSPDFNTFVAGIEKIDAADALAARRLFRTSQRLREAMDVDWRRRPFAAAPTAGPLGRATAIGSLSSPLPLRMWIRRKLRHPASRALVLAALSAAGCWGWRARGSGLGALAHLVELGGWTAEGGMPAVLTSLLRVCDLLGVKILTDARATRIELENGRVRRVSGEGFKPIAVSLAVCAEGDEAALRALLPGGALSDTQRKLTAGLVQRSEFGVFAAFKQPLASVAPCTVFVGDPYEEARFTDLWRIPPALPSIHALVARHADFGAAPQGHAALSLRCEMPAHPARFRWSEQWVDEIRGQLLQAIEKRGIKKLRESLDGDPICWAPGLPASSGDHTRSASNAPVVDSFGAYAQLLPNRAPRVPGLYLASPCAHPGPGFARSILAGMVAAVCAAEDAR